MSDEKVVPFKRRPVHIGGFEIVSEYSAGDEGPGYKFVEKPVAKSTTSVMQANVCQACGHRLDGQDGKTNKSSYGSDGKACTCFCHREK